MRNTQKSGQILRSKKRPRPTGRSGKGRRINSNTFRQILALAIETGEHVKSTVWQRVISVGLSATPEEGQLVPAPMPMTGIDRLPATPRCCEPGHIAFGGPPRIGRAGDNTCP